MALEGNLSSFGLSEILQLIAVQQKTGMLTVSSQSSTTVMFFRDGKIISTRDRRRKAVDPFKDYLTRYGVLNREDLIRISQISAQSKLDLTDILESEELFSADDLQKHFRNQIQEAMHDVLTWEQCTYKFITNENIVKDIKTVGEYNIEAMLMESMRRIDEFPRLLEMFPNDHILVALAEDTDEDVASTDMIGNERAILGSLDDSVSIRDLIATSKMPLFEVYEALKLLKDKNLICVKNMSQQAPVEAPSQAATKTAPKSRRNPLPFVFALVLLSLSLFVGGDGLLKDLEPHKQLTIESLQESSIARNQLAEKLRWVIEAYHAQYGVYPSSFEALRSAGLATPRMLEEAEAFSIRYRLTPGGPTFTLL